MKPVVTIDGPSGSGKSTVARMLSERLGYLHLDTGAMYRAVALAARRAGIAYDDRVALDSLCVRVRIDLQPRDGSVGVFLDGEDVTDQIRTPEMSRGSSAVSSVPEVRLHMVKLQRELGKVGGVVAEGRDMGTVVFPDSPAKFYLDASIRERAKRRWLEMEGKGIFQEPDEVLMEMETRDRNDATREHSPLRKAPDAVYVDTSDMTIQEVVDLLAGMVSRMERNGA